MTTEHQTERISRMFDTVPRSDGSGSIFVLKDSQDEPDVTWVREAVVKAHEAAGTNWPNDWVYEKCFHIFASLDDNFICVDDDDCIQLGAPMLAEMLVDIYYRDLTDWLSSDWSFASWVDDAMEHQGQFWDAVSMAQFYCLEAMVSVLAEAYRENAS